MSEELRKKLEAEKMEATWPMLQEHCQRGALILLAPSLDLVSVAIAIAQDNVEQVAAWLTSGDLQKLDIHSDFVQELKGKEISENEKIGLFLIVQPYVLLQTSTPTP